MSAKDGERKDAREIIRGLGWPDGVSVERIAASVFDRAVRAGVVEGEVILGYTFDRGQLPGWAEREDRLLVAVYALCHYLADRDRLDELRYDGNLVADEVLATEEWTSASPRLPGMQGLYEAARREWDEGKSCASDRSGRRNEDVQRGPRRGPHSEDS